jgi:hypothetical protein
MVMPGARRAMTRRGNRSGPPGTSGMTSDAIENGTHASVGMPIHSPAKPGGAMPMIVYDTSFKRSVRPIASGVPPNRRCQ